MQTDRIDKMRRGRDIPQVALQKYNQLRARNPGKIICAFEGQDDVSFYDVMFIRIASISYVPLVCNGKDKVLELRVLLSRNTSVDSGRVRYFIDNDFDGLKGHASGSDLYCTPCYSFENLLVNKPSLETLLKAEYRCSDENGDIEVQKIGEMFDSRLSEFIDCMRNANHIIYFARTRGIKTSEIIEDIKKYVYVCLDYVKHTASNDDLYKLVGFSSEPDPEQLKACEEEFEKLDPCIAWRGKFFFAFFRKFLSDLKDDRGTKTPKYFHRRASMSFSPGTDVIRTIASTISIPQCLHTFVTTSFNT